MAYNKVAAMVLRQETYRTIRQLDGNRSTVREQLAASIEDRIELAIDTDTDCNSLTSAWVDRLTLTLESVRAE